MDAWARIIRALGAEVITHALNVVNKLLLIPLFISVWGTELYGYWIVIVSSISWLTIGDLGAQVYYINSLTVLSETDQHKYNRTLTTGLYLFTAISSVIFLLVLGVYFSEVAPRFFGVPNSIYNDTNIVLLLLGIKISLSFINGYLLGIFRTIKRQATSVMVVNFILVLQFAMSVVALCNKSGIITLAAVEVIPIVISALFATIYLFNLNVMNFNTFSFLNFNSSIFKESIKPSFHFFIIQVSQILSTQGVIIALSRFSSPETIVVFSTLRTISNIVSQLLGMLTHSAWPEFTRYYSKLDYDSLLKVFKTIFSVTYFCGFLYLIGMEFLGEIFFTIWLSKKITFDSKMMFLLNTYVVLGICWKLSSSLLMATNNHREVSYIQLITNTISLVVFFLIGEQHGIHVAILSLIISHSVLLIVASYFCISVHFDERFRNYILKSSLLIVLLNSMSANRIGAVISLGLITIFGVYVVRKIQLDRRLKG